MARTAAKRAEGGNGANEGSKFRTTPIKDTITHVKQLPKSAVLYKCPASSYWQFRVFLEGSQRKRSTKKTELAEAQREAKLIYADMLQSIHGSEEGKLKLSGKRTLQAVAASLWEKQAVMIAQDELNPQQNRNEKYVFERHIKPFFKDVEIKAITPDLLEQFKMNLARHKLSKSTQRAYFVILSKLLQEAAKKQYINHIPIMPRVRLTDEPRGYFNPTEYTKLWQTAKRLAGSTVPIYREKDMMKDGKPKQDAKPYRSVKITQDCFNLIMFMRHTYIRPTDIKVILHKNVTKRVSANIEFLVLKHDATKRHHRVMVSTEYASKHYDEICKQREAEGYGKPDDYVFLPNQKNREYALKELTRQFEVVLKAANLKTDAHGKNRTLYRLRHTAIVTGIHDGISPDTLALNARTSLDMIDRFYGSHVQSALDKGTEITDRIHAKRKRYEEMEK